ncbi:MAG TPA: hypothetical protein VFY04_03485 [Solirubrobacterales bacterium]|nr:hypothetical protein [Solirubrobacterales bacterium]
MLYLLAREFVAKPATAVRGLPEAEVGHLLQADVSEVVERSARGSESEELSAHALLDTVSSRWDGLRSASLEIWGP